jgi:hypothetical protein
MDAASTGVPAGDREDRRRSRRVRFGSALAAGVLPILLLTGCDAGGSATTGTPSATSTQTDGVEGGDGVTDGTGGGAVSEFTAVEVSELLADPGSYVGEQVRVTGSVFFISECPPPGADTTGCVLLGYLAPPEQRTLIAADVSGALALAEHGRRLSCPEGSQPAPTCGDWASESTYTVDGVLERQVLGGRETELVQLDVSGKSDPTPW